MTPLTFSVSEAKLRTLDGCGLRTGAIFVRRKCIPFWFAILDATRPVRKLFGLRQPVLDAALRKNRR